MEFRTTSVVYSVLVMQTYQTMTAVMMRTIIPVTSPPRYAPTSAAVFEVGVSITSCNSGVGVDVGLGCSSGVQHTLTMVAV